MLYPFKFSLYLAGSLCKHKFLCYIIRFMNFSLNIQPSVFFILMYICINFNVTIQSFDMKFLTGNTRTQGYGCQISNCWINWQCPWQWPKPVSCRWCRWLLYQTYIKASISEATWGTQYGYSIKKSIGLLLKTTVNCGSRKWNFVSDRFFVIKLYIWAISTLFAQDVLFHFKYW